MSDRQKRRLQGKVAIITGAGRGIGRGIAKLFAEEGAKVVINYNRSSKAAKELCDEIRRDGRSCLLVKGDVSKSIDVRNIVSATLQKFGRIDILVNNAGLIIRKNFLESTEEEWDRTIDTNLKGVYLCSRQVAPIMLKQKRGKIVNISSVSGMHGPTSSLMVADYVASKAGVIGLTRSLAVNLAPYVNVNAVCPGAIETDMLESIPEQARRSRMEETPLKRFGSPEEIAAAVLFLASDESDFITGEALVVSGGRPTG